MKKQFLLTTMMVLIGVCFCTLNHSNLKACDANATACSVIKKEGKKNSATDPAGDVELSFDTFMNPFIPL